MQLENEELCDLITEVDAHLKENLRSVLIHLNNSGQLVDFLEMIEAKHLLKNGPSYDWHTNGRIIVVGQTDVKKNDLEKAAKWLGIDPDRFEFYLEYERVPNLSHIRYNPSYAAILVGPMPHSTENMCGHSSTLVAWEEEPGYPPVERMGQTSLKITKSTFQDALQKLLDKGIIVATKHN